MKEIFKEVEKIYSSKHLLVVGDVMLDKYIWGTTDRISPEAPVPVVHIENVDYHAGGAANVARNISGLGGRVSLVGLIGNDSTGSTLKTILAADDLSDHYLVSDPRRITTVKTRIIAQGQHVVRLDDEDDALASADTTAAIKEIMTPLLGEVDGILLQDYNKGVLSAELISWIIARANEDCTPVYVDPKKHHFSSYQGARLFKPNYTEYLSVIRTGVDLETAGEAYRKENEFEVLLITRGADGMSLFQDGNYIRISTRARSVHDVSGAGDTVIATFALNDVCGLEPTDSAMLANLAAGKVCEAVGVVPVTSHSLMEIVDHYQE
ncbi:MAG: PfkB family carbohydrate kinase [Candidatus Neomarinimicrobiota bacterium]|nr:PfkB family carbohydrate kinase [Candidatus Neomarinimicrobiota bacterium]